VSVQAEPEKRESPGVFRMRLKSTTIAKLERNKRALANEFKAVSFDEIASKVEAIAATLAERSASTITSLPSCTATSETISASARSRGHGARRPICQLGGLSR
jgi:hypothetical protein